MPTFGLSLMPEPSFAAAALPLFDQGVIGALEWSFDLGWGPAGVPDWVDALLDDYSESGDLVGHGVSFSLLSGEWTPHHARWLERLRIEVGSRHYRHVSEHVGFVGAGRFSFAAPLPVPIDPSVIEMGRHRMQQIADAAGCPVGLENLATSLGPDDARLQGNLVDQLLEPVDGFVVLDLHNLWAQAHNLSLDPIELVSGYPLDRVREVHVSGGSWDGGRDRPIRRDTHDGLVPTRVVDLLRAVAPRCPQLELVVYERLGPTLADPAGHASFRDDVVRLSEVVTSL